MNVSAPGRETHRGWGGGLGLNILAPQTAIETTSLDENPRVHIYFVLVEI